MDLNTVVLNGVTYSLEANLEGSDGRAYANPATGFFAMVMDMARHVDSAFQGTSPSSLEVSVGTKTLVLEKGAGFAPPQPILLADAQAPSTNYMSGRVLSFDQATRELEVDVEAIVGGGTHSSWILSAGRTETTPATIPATFAQGGSGAMTAAGARANYQVARTVPVIAVAEAPRKAPTDGDIYLVAPVPTGDFAGHPGELAIFSVGTGTWVFESPVAGDRVVDLEQDEIWGYEGLDWALLTNPRTHPLIEVEGSHSPAVAELTQATTVITAKTKDSSVAVISLPEDATQKEVVVVADAGNQVHVRVNVLGGGLISGESRFLLLAGDVLKVLGTKGTGDTWTVLSLDRAADRSTG